MNDRDKTKLTIVEILDESEAKAVTAFTIARHVLTPGKKNWPMRFLHRVLEVLVSEGYVIETPMRDAPSEYHLRKNALSDLRASLTKERNSVRDAHEHDITQLAEPSFDDEPASDDD